ncbi:hypothetical protein S7335_2174 [Synechococcus sp. PCC 7335]|nr:hypothetical protein S7335_2174 [Synechococcus sp. PCC 7335]
MSKVLFLGHPNIEIPLPEDRCQEINVVGTEAASCCCLL